MPIESATYINTLEPTNPAATDSLADSDNHIRLIKAALKATFPNLDGVVSGKAANLNAYVPIGGIIAWSGALGAIPAGWVLCNGQTGLTRTDGLGTINAPNLVDRFIVGAGSAYGVGAAAGSVSHAHGVSVAVTALVEANLPPHTHPVIDPGHVHLVSDPGHGHNYFQFQDNGGFTTAVTGATQAQAVGDNTLAATSNSFTGISLFANTTGIAVGSTGSGVPHGHSASTDFQGHLPPYYALAFIMKI